MPSLRTAIHNHIAIGDLTFMQMASEGCDDPECSCAGVIVSVTGAQLDTQGFTLSMPLASWVLLSSFAQHALVKAAPDLAGYALTAIEHDTQERTRTAHYTALIPLRHLNAGRYHQLRFGMVDDVEPNSLQEMLEGAVIVIADDDDEDPPMIGEWVRFRTGGKVHAVRAIEERTITTGCGRKGDDWDPIRAPLMPADFCLPCWQFNNDLIFKEGP